MYYFYTAGVTVGLFIPASPKFVKNALYYDVTLAMVSLGDRKFSALK